MLSNSEYVMMAAHQPAKRKNGPTIERESLGFRVGSKRPKPLRPCKPLHVKQSIDLNQTEDKPCPLVGSGFAGGVGGLRRGYMSTVRKIGKVALRVRDLKWSPLMRSMQSKRSKLEDKDPREKPTMDEPKARVKSIIDESKPSPSIDADRCRVRDAIDIFRATCSELFLARKAAKRPGAAVSIYFEAAMRLKQLGKWVHAGQQLMGAVPGVEVGDQFCCRAELVVIGLHHQFMNGIDTMEYRGQKVAISIVNSGRYANSVVSSDVLIYSGHGGNPGLGGDKQPGDQKLACGNLALRNSMIWKTPVRVIFSFGDAKPDYFFGKHRKTIRKPFVYNGLYLVERLWQERGQFGKLVYRFELRRIPGQAQGWRFPSRIRNRRLVCTRDVSQGKETKPIPAVNAVDLAKPPSFDYTATVTYLDGLAPRPVRGGCCCLGGCSDPSACACAVRNGEGFPYDPRGAIVGQPLLVFECGPSCACPQSCPNRVTQHRIKFSLEIFRTRSGEWGIRSPSYISAGSFVCEYAGEVRPGEEGGFVVDAARAGNVGRFIGHSCSPNLHARCVLYDHDDVRMPHVMLFATSNIAPVRELTLDYRQEGSWMRVSNGDADQSCRCGSGDCKSG